MTRTYDHRRLGSLLGRKFSDTDHHHGAAINQVILSQLLSEMVSFPNTVGNKLGLVAEENVVRKRASSLRRYTAISYGQRYSLEGFALTSSGTRTAPSRKHPGHRVGSLEPRILYVQSRTNGLLGPVIDREEMEV